MDKSKRIEVSLDHFADKTKSNEKIYANLAESIYDGTTYIKSGLSTLDIVTILGICATALNTCFLWIIYRRYRILIVSLTMARQIHAVCVANLEICHNGNIISNMKIQEINETAPPPGYAQM